MVNDAEKFKEEDKLRKEAIESSNRADQLCNDTEKSLEEFGDKIDKVEAENVKKLIEGVRELVIKVNSGENIESTLIKEKFDELQNASLKLFEKMYKDQQSQQQSQEGGEEKK
ncbi:unnamed protein product [[Candida] boidinii]|nr:unnamed protein product [[Candida] boidinii]